MRLGCRPDAVATLLHVGAPVAGGQSMEEADVLGDKIVVMAAGTLRCVGSSVHLKNRFAGAPHSAHGGAARRPRGLTTRGRWPLTARTGPGYTLQLVVTAGQEDAVRSLVRKHLRTDDRARPSAGGSRARSSRGMPAGARSRGRGHAQPRRPTSAT